LYLRISKNRALILLMLSTAALHWASCRLVMFQAWPQLAHTRDLPD